jgi:hypothetical protein
MPLFAGLYREFTVDMVSSPFLFAEKLLKTHLFALSF